jgi:hypothetical protein
MPSIRWLFDAPEPLLIDTDEVCRRSLLLPPAAPSVGVAPGTIDTRLTKLRPEIGRSWTSLSVTSELNVEVSVWSRGASAITCTDSTTAPTCRRASTRVRSPLVRTAREACGVKPPRSIVTV